MELAPVARRSVVDGAYDQLASQILDGGLGAGTTLPPERRLTELLGVNRQAVREALQRLAQDGLVAIQHGGATRVTNFRRDGQLHLLPRLLLTESGRLDREVIRSVIEMRACLAPDIARLAAQRATPDVVAQATALAEQMDAAGSDAERSLLNLDLWDALVDGADNIAYRLAYNTLRSCFAPVAAVLAPTLAEELNDAVGRARLIAAVRKGDAAAARKAAERLLIPSTTALTELLSSL
jgi:DNA-binding FadR family transcriptional regulator